jgi:phospholipase/carboxylesterase
MNAQDNDVVEATVAMVARTMDALEVLGFIARHLHPPDIASLVQVLGDADTALRAAGEQIARVAWPEHLLPFRDQAQRAAALTLRACDGLRAAASPGADTLRQAFRSLRDVSRGLEAMYPLATSLPSVSRFFLAPDRRGDQALLDRLAAAASRSDDTQVGVLHADNATDQRGGFSVFVPEDYDPARPYPVVMALHGGSGHGRLFLWSWVREARGRGVIVVSPTAVGDTWSLMQPELDAANLVHVLEQVAQTWRIDRGRLLLTGMSDGGTFTLLSGIDQDSPFTHLAPVAASFHPLLLSMAPPQRLLGLPVYLVHGALDWMFPVSVARSAHSALDAAGAKVVYRELTDLSHAYPREENSLMLDWFLEDEATL